MKASENHVGVKSGVRLISSSWNPIRSILYGLSYGEVASLLGVLDETKEYLRVFPKSCNVVSECLENGILFQNWSNSALEYIPAS